MKIADLTTIRDDRLREELDRREAQAKEDFRRKLLNSPDYCKWEHDQIYDMWDTDCEQAFQFISDGPKENKFGFCPYCGRRIIIEKEDEDD